MRQTARRLLQGCFLCLGAVIALGGVSQAAATEQDRTLMRDILQNICREAPPTNGATEVATPKPPKTHQGSRQPPVQHSLWRLSSDRYLQVVRPKTPGRALIFADLSQGAHGQTPLLRGVVTADCTVLGGREIRYGTVASKLTPLSVLHLDATLQNTGKEDGLNPPVPAGRPRDCQRIGVLDNGINYQLPLFKDRLARDATGALIGYDVWEQDDRPFDYGVPPRRGPSPVSLFRPNHHGTMVASVVLDYAPVAACLVPMRYPPFSKGNEVAQAVDYLKSAGVQIVSIQSSRVNDWPVFRRAIQEAPDMLFIIAAGNNGQDMRQRPSYPTVYDLPNLLVVGGTQANENTLWERSNTGQGIVDIAVRATDVPVTRFDGGKAALSGTSFAAPKVAGFAARLHAQNSALRGKTLHDAIIEQAHKSGVTAGQSIPVLTDQQMRSR
ncbi:MAG: S8 family serine peptidase [Pseudoruegeria sp.]